MKSRGFVLIELLAIIGLVFVLTVVAVPKYRDYLLQRNAEQSARTGIYHREKGCVWWEDDIGVRHAHCQEASNGL